MKAYLMLDDKMTSKMLANLERIDECYLIILADKDVYHKLKRHRANQNYVLIDLFTAEFDAEKVQLTEKFAEDLLKANPHLEWEGYNLPEMTINDIYSDVVSIIYNLVTQLEKIIIEWGITTLVLFGGSPRIQYLGVSLSEGERPFRFLYKRCWFLNYFVNEAFHERMNIVWRDKTSSALLKFFGYVRSVSILGGKFALLLKRCLHRQRNSLPEELRYPVAMFVVRNPIQVEPLIPLYNEFLARKEITPVYLAFENYSNNKIVEVLQKNKLRYHDLYDLLTLRILLRAFINLRLVRKRAEHDSLIVLTIGKHSIKLSTKKLIDELSVLWVDIFILNALLNDWEVQNHWDIRYLVNNETHGHYSAIEAAWAKKRRIPSIGIQHVAVAERLLPRISRVDTMFMMSKNIAEKLGKLKPTEKFVYIGPMAYDLYFNSTEHKGEFNVITLFTQPDDFKKEHIQIAEDIVDVILRNQLSLEFYVKLHPREKDVDAFRRATAQLGKARIITNEIGSSDLIKHSDLAISIHSGTLMQSIIIGTPTLSVNYDRRHNIDMDFITHDVTKKVYDKGELEECLINPSELGRRYAINRGLFVKDVLRGYDGNAASRVYEYIREYMQRPQ